MKYQRMFDKVEPNIKIRTNIIATKSPFKTSLVTSIKKKNTLTNLINFKLEKNKNSLEFLSNSYMFSLNISKSSFQSRKKDTFRKTLSN